MHALLMGIDNYPGSDADLSGCVNDVGDWAELLGPQCETVKLLTNRQCTKVAMVREMKRVLNATAPGDWAFILYSGHGTWIPDANGDEPDGRDEALVPYDYDERLLLDDEIKDLLLGRPAGSRVFFVSDSCHSGTVFRLMGAATHARMRFLPPEKLGRVPEHVGLTLARQARLPRQRALPGVVHLSGCGDTEYSYEHVDADGRSTGAMSTAAREAYAEMQRLKKSKRTFAEWHSRICKRLPTYDYPQSPQLNAYASEKRLIVPGLERR